MKNVSNERKGQSASCLGRCGLSDRTKIGGNRSETLPLLLCLNPTMPTDSQRCTNSIDYLNQNCLQSLKYNELVISSSYYTTVLAHSSNIIIHYYYMKAEGITVCLQNLSHKIVPKHVFHFS